MYAFRKARGGKIMPTQLLQKLYCNPLVKIKYYCKYSFPLIGCCYFSLWFLLTVYIGRQLNLDY
jgi:hypothetical protein